MNTRTMPAFDLGAESGRAILGHFDGEHLRLEENTALPTDPCRFSTDCTGTH